MRRLLWMAAALALAGAASPAGAAGLTIRLVEASNRGEGVGGGLGDVASVLRGNMPYDTFRLIDSKSLPLPAGGRAGMSMGYEVACSGDVGNLTISVSNGGRKVLQSTVSLSDRRPLILGGFPAAGGKLILILTAR